MRLYGISGFFVAALVALLTVPAPAHAACTAPDGVLGEVTYNDVADAFQGCTARGWMAFNTIGDPPCDSLGAVCADGTIYAGLSPDGNVPMYIMPTDGPEPGGYSWNDGTFTGVNTAMPDCVSWASAAASCNTGRANTAFLAAIPGPSPAPYTAALYCDSLVSNGYDDWYLPAQNEIKIFYTLATAGQAGFATDVYYWSSTEDSDYNAWLQYTGMDTGTRSIKNMAYSVRCARR